MADVAELFQQAVQLHQGGQITQAEQLYRQILHTEPRHGGALSNLGVVLVRQNRLEEAVQAYQQAIQVDPRHADAFFNLGNAYRKLDRPTDAVAAYQAVLQLNPQHAGAMYNLGLAWWSLARWDEARQCFEIALHRDPKLIEARNHLGFCYQRLGRIDDAIATYRQVIQQDRKYIRGYHNLGLALASQQKYPEAVEQFEQALAIDPNYAEAHNSLGVTLEALNQSEQALQHYERAVQLKPAFTDALNNLGIAYTESGRHDEAIEARRMALALDPGQAHVHSNLLLTMNYSAEIDPPSLLEEHKQWAHEHADPLKSTWQRHTNDRTNDRILRIGYVSADFRDHTVARFLLPLIGHFDPQRFHVTGFSNVMHPDAITNRLKMWCNDWHTVVGLPDDQFAAFIRQEQIDILVDLSGHTAGNRLLTFARKPAPIQVTLFGYPNTTGMEAIDYRISDDFADPIGLTEQFYVERIYRLPEVAWCYEPPPNMPEVGPLPCDRAGHLTFGSLNNPAKLTPPILRTWAEILHAIPKARLILLTGRGGFGTQLVAERFRNAGIASERLELLPRQKLEEYLRLHQRIDVCLDPYPYNGGVTTCDALWMGVPVLTQAGPTYVSRQGLSLLSNVGLPDLVAYDSNEYVARAKGLVENVDWLRELRRGLRDRMRQSALIQARRYVEHLETAYLAMWQEYVSQGG